MTSEIDALLDLYQTAEDAEEFIEEAKSLIARGDLTKEERALKRKETLDWMVRLKDGMARLGVRTQ
jgi:hypothetical protein